MNKNIIYLLPYLFYPFLVTYAQSNPPSKQTNNFAFSVPAPWTPLQIKQNDQIVSIESWGRKYIFNHTLLPFQIYSQDVPLLSRPIDIIMSSNGKSLQFDTALIKIISKTGASIELKAISKSKENQFGAIEITAKIHIEYDGLMLISLNTKYPADFKPGLFTIEIPYNSNISKYYIKGANRSNINSQGGFSLKNGLLLESDFTPYFWVGDNYRGLFWFCESPQNWPNAQKPTAIQILGQENEVVQKFDLGAANFYQFGIQATPVKPLPHNWRNLRFSPAVNSNIVILWPQPGNPSSTRYFGWPEAVNDDNYANLIKKYHQNNKIVLSYATITTLPSLLPIYQENKTNWIEGKKAMRVKMDSLIFIEPNSKNYKETISQQLPYFLRKYDLDGYYLDLTKSYPYLSNNQKYYPILGYRELQKKVIRFCKI